AAESIDRLTQQARVVSYLKQRQRLPDYYISKKQAREQGWDARDGNLCSVLPGKAIGGDRFSNREGQLPAASNRIWREADINYRCGRRGAERLLFSNDGLIFVTHDHYKNFIRVE
ncbi:MAG: ribonuclease domain-containing protein, partial [Gibbsiella quercinecans]|uniref:ribonuclease domain-containing protein n=1 Tax=Gibbsiella quercinecans TaxID=929813 RepID=UPI003F2E2471